MKNESMEQLNALKDVVVEKLWAQADASTHLFNNSYSINYQMQLPTKPHFGFRFLQFQLENHNTISWFAKIYLIETIKSCPFQCGKYMCRYLLYDKKSG